MPAQTVASTVTSFMAYLSRRGRAPRTRAKYGRYLKDFVAWAGAADPGTITAQEIELEYLSGWFERFEALRGRPPAPHTVRLHIGALKSYYAFLERFDLVGKNPMRQIDAPQPPRKANDWLSGTDDEALLRACETPSEKIVVSLLRFSGLRIGEARTLTNRDVDLAAGTITVRMSKTPAGRRMIPILQELRPHIQSWQQHQMQRGLMLPERPFLSTANGTPMHSQFAWRLVKRVAKRASIHLDSVGTSSVSPHTLRRTFGSDLLNRNVRLEVVSKLLMPQRSSTHSTARANPATLEGAGESGEAQGSPPRPEDMRIDVSRTPILLTAPLALVFVTGPP
jgi:site-specific recombinase XerD